MEISKKDWTLYRSKLPNWQEDYMDCLNQHYLSILTDKERCASTKFWELEEQITQDKRHPGVITRVSRSNMLHTFIVFLRDGEVQEEELNEFSEEIRPLSPRSFADNSHIPI